MLFDKLYLTRRKLDDKIMQALALKFPPNFSVHLQIKLFFTFHLQLHYIMITQGI